MSKVLKNLALFLITLGFFTFISRYNVVNAEPRPTNSPKLCAIKGIMIAANSAVFTSGFTIDTNGVKHSINACSSPSTSDKAGATPLQVWSGAFEGVVSVHFQPYNIQGWAESRLVANVTIDYSYCANVTEHNIKGTSHGSTGATYLLSKWANITAVAGLKNGGSGCLAYNFSAGNKGVTTKAYHTFTPTQPGYISGAGDNTLYQQYKCLAS